MRTATATKEPYQQSAEEVLHSLVTDARRGLSEGESRARLEGYGRNVLTAEKRVPRWRKFLAQFQDVLVVLQLVATNLSLDECGRRQQSFRLRIGHKLIRDEMIRRLQLAAVLLGMMAIGFIGAWLLVSAAFQ